MIKVSDLCKTFKLYRSPSDRLKEIVTRRKYCQEFSALNGVNFEVQAGETLGVIGQNGAGKSTLLKILTGVLLADSGSVEIDGKITGLLELGTGFNTEFSGLQNIYLNGTLLGMSKDEIQTKLNQIVAFTELGEFVRRPLKTYSSGMIMRLAFSIAIHADPKVFVVDEALSVGDAYFQQKCMDRIKQFRQQGGSIIFVSHDMNAVKVLCDGALLLNHGLVVEQGAPDKVIDTYNFLLAKKAKGEEIRIRPHVCGDAKAYGNFKVQITDVRLVNARGGDSEFFVCGAPCTVLIEIETNEDVDDLTVGIMIRDRFGQDIFGTNTFHLKLPIILKKGQKCKVRYDFQELNLGPGKYTLTVAAHKSETHVQDCYQWIDVVKTFEMTMSTDFTFIGLSKLKPYVNVETL